MKNKEEYFEINKEAYEIAASEYAERKPLFSENNRTVADRFCGLLEKQIIGIKRNKISILDIGVGSGLDLKIFEEKNFQTFGTDISQKMIDIAKINAPKTEYYYGNFVDINFNRQFHGLYAQAFIHLFPSKDVENVFHKILAILKPSGLVHFSTTVHTKSSEGYEEKGDYKSRVKRYRTRWSLNDLNKLIERLPVKVVDQYLIKDPIGKTWVNTIIGHKQPR